MLISQLWIFILSIFLYLNFYFEIRQVVQVLMIFDVDQPKIHITYVLIVSFQILFDFVCQKFMLKPKGIFYIQLYFAELC